MKEQIRIVISIVISAVLLGLVVVFCINTWMPADTMGWLLFGAMALCGVFAIHRIANLAKALGMLNKSNDKE